MIWASGILLGLTGLFLLVASLRPKRSDPAGNGLEIAYLAFGWLIWGVLAGLTALGVAWGSRWLQGAPLLLVIVPAAFALKRLLAAVFFRLGSKMPTPALRRLERAAHVGRSGDAKEILATGVDVRDPAIGRSLLKTALRGRYGRDVIEVLLDAGADPKDPEILGMALHSRFTDVLTFVEHGADPNTVVGGEPLILAALHSGRIHEVEQLAKRGATPNVKDQDGWPLLLLHASGRVGTGPGNWYYVRTLIDLGADPDVPGPDGTTVAKVLAAYPYSIHPDHEPALRARLKP